MDNDDFRRGVPTNHKVFGEAIAILAGDALLTEAFEYFALGANDGVSPEKLIEVIGIAVKAAGYRGMIGGQVIDLECENRKVDLATVEYMHIHKTGALLSASLEDRGNSRRRGQSADKGAKNLRPSFRACVSDYGRSSGCRGGPGADGQNAGIGCRKKQNDLSCSAGYCAIQGGRTGARGEFSGGAGGFRTRQPNLCGQSPGTCWCAKDSSDKRS